MERQWIRRLIVTPLRVRLDGAISGPVQGLEDVRVPDVLHDPAVRREAERTHKFTVLPNLKGEDIRDTVHRMEEEAATPGCLQQVFE